MEGVAAPAARRSADRFRRLDAVGLTLLAYLPFLLSSPGKVSPDTKQYLYLDPGRFLARAPYLWDPHVGFGAVPHQQIGYLFPMGPYFWLMDALGAPDWIAQRLWLGTISLAAALGARWLFTMLGTRRFGALAGALVYMLTPYQLAFTARISVLLLAWAGLPWLVGLTMRAVRDGGWRDPALVALVVLTIGSVNASSLVFVLIGPALWLVLHACSGRSAAADVARVAGRLAVLVVGVSLWWVVGIRTQGAYGLPVLQLTESLRTVAASSSPTDLVRGIGNWFFYGFDRVGASIDQATDYLHDTVVIVASFAVPVLAFAVAGVLRWRHRAYFVLLVVVGTVVGVGAWPYDDPTPYGALFKAFGDTSAGLALRNTPRVVPLIVLGLAGLVAAGVSSFAVRRREVVAACVVVVIVGVAFLPVWRVGYLSSGLERANDIPSYWQRAATAMQRDGDATRVLEIPGSSFSAYRWGNTVEPVTPGLIDRPYIAREVLPVGTPASVNLLDALDHRLQEGTFEPVSLAAYARLVNVGTIVLRSDLQYERFDTPRPRLLWSQLTSPLAPGLEAPRPFGAAKPNLASPQLPMLDNVDLRIPADAQDPPPVALFEVVDPVPIVHTAPSARPVLVSGDGDGIVDAAAAGLIDGRQLVLESAGLDDAALERALRAGADLVLTDSNRRRSKHYFSRIRDTSGYTERAGETAPHEGDGFRLEPFPGAGDAARTVVEQHGGQVGASDYAVAADRPANAFDGDPGTAWRVGGHAVGERIAIRTDHPVRTDHVTLAQVPSARSITSVRLRFDGNDVLDVHLGPESRTPAGQVVTFPERTVRTLEVEIRQVSLPDPDPIPRIVGFTEIGLGNVRVRETVRLPVDLARRAGANSDGHSLDVVLSRLRYGPGQLQDEELALDRRFVLPDARSFAVSGTVRVDPNAADAALDTTLATTAAGTIFTSSDHLWGDADARASRAFDGDPKTAWSPNFGIQDGRWIAVSLPAPVTVDHVDLTIVADGRHSVPTQFTLSADGVPVRTFTITPFAAGKPGTTGTTRTVRVPFDAVTGRELKLSVDVAATKLTTVQRGYPKIAAPVAIAEIGLAGVSTAPADGPPSTVCRDDLLRVNGTPVSLRIRGTAAQWRSGLAIESCDGALALPAGSNTVRSAPGLDTTIDIDRVVLSSDAAGAPPGLDTTLGAPLARSGARVRVVDSSPVSYRLRVRTDGAPFWLVLGQSASAGWEANTTSGSVAPRQLVDGFANGWLITPKGPGSMELSLRWTPQRFVWIGFAVSAVAVLACVALVVLSWRRRRRGVAPEVADVADPLADRPTFLGQMAHPTAVPSSTAVVALAVGAAVATAFFSRPWIGIVVGLATFAAARLTRGRILLVAGAPVALALARMTRFDDLAWLAVALLAADLVTGWVRARRRPTATATSSPAET
jgi:arabinofuranan 3-O-arabinosyltransferase